MSYEPVDITVQDQDGLPVEGAVVKVYDEAGALFYSQSTTDGDGNVGFTLFAPKTYSLRFYKFQVGFTQPQLIEVLEAPETNVFDIEAEVQTPPVATDPRLCRCSGYFRDVTGAIQPNVDIHFIARFDPILLDGSAVLSERRSIRSDENGYVEIDLIRNSYYDVTIEGMEDCLRQVIVPDMSSADLPHMLLEVVDRVAFAEDEPFTVAEGSEIELTPSVYTSAGRLLEGAAGSDVFWQIEDPEIANISVGADKLTISGSSAGTTQLLASRRDTSIVRIPEPGVLGVPVTITVT